MFIHLFLSGPDLIVCDEGHVIKNGKAIRSKALSKVKTRRRIVLTGTPIQNNLKECERALPRNEMKCVIFGCCRLLYGRFCET